ncbi:MAG: hypothetical protein WC491_05270 [Candidatus Omnitrophota bacterium]
MNASSQPLNRTPLSLRQLAARWPYWLKGGCAAGIIGTAVFIFLPGDVSNLAYTPWWAGWLVLPAFLIFGAICIVFRVDFISDTVSKFHLALLSALWVFSIFITLFAIGSLIGLVIEIIKSKKNV